MTVTSTAKNWDVMTFRFFDGDSERSSNGVSAYTYASPGTYKITQCLRAYVNGEYAVVELTKTVTVSAPHTETVSFAPLLSSIEPYETPETASGGGNTGSLSPVVILVAVLASISAAFILVRFR